MSLAHFKADSFPGKPRILFVGLGESSHTHSWIDLLDGSHFNVRLFAMPSGFPVEDWPVRTYVTAYDHPVLDSATRVCLYPSNRALRFAKWAAGRYDRRSTEEMAARWLAKAIREWQPDVIHTLGLKAARLYFRARQNFRLEGIGKWVLQLRGGSDLTPAHLDPTVGESLAEVLRGCDSLLSDNLQNFAIARMFGVADQKFASIAPVPGTGGVDVDAIATRWQRKPSERRTIIWPKAYEVPWSKVLPVYEALKICWERIQPCAIQMLSMNNEARMWYWSLPACVRERCHPMERVTRTDVLELLTQARVMLAPSLVDGVPNSLYEAMAAGAFPIVSPLDTIRPVVEEERNVLFARNLYPEEIASALVRAMTDDALVDSAAEANLALVRRIANRAEIRLKVIKFYENLIGDGQL